MGIITSIIEYLPSNASAKSNNCELGSHSANFKIGYVEDRAKAIGPNEKINIIGNTMIDASMIDLANNPQIVPRAI